MNVCMYGGYGVHEKAKTKPASKEQALFLHRVTPTGFKPVTF